MLPRPLGPPCRQRRRLLSAVVVFPRSGACVPTGFSEVDCAGGSGKGPGYVSTKNFQVVGPDVYGLNADEDGIGCVSR